LPGKALIISPPYKLDRIRPIPPELKLNYIIPINPKKPIMAPKVSLSKRAAPT